MTSVCTLTFALYTTAGAAYTGSGVTISSSTGDVSVDTNTVQSVDLKVQHTYDGTSAFGTNFHVSVCPTLTQTNIPNYSIVLNGGATVRSLT